VIGPTQIVVPGEDFAGAFAVLEALGPVTRVPFLALDPDASFSLAAVAVKAGLNRRRARGARLQGSAWGVAGLGEGLADDLAGIAHLIGLLITSGVGTVLGEADALQELSQLPGLLVGESDGDLEGFHFRFSRSRSDAAAC
jgi:hypothetical protein